MKTVIISITVALMAALAVYRKLSRRKPSVGFANVGEGTYETGIKSFLFDTGGATANAAALAANTTSQGRFLLYKNTTDGDHLTVCGLNDVSIGIGQDAYDAVNFDVPINVALHGAGQATRKVVTDGTITNGLPVKAGATGQTTAATTGDAGIFGRAVIGTDTTAAAGDIITVVTMVPMKYAF